MITMIFCPNFSGTDFKDNKFQLGIYGIFSEYRQSNPVKSILVKSNTSSTNFLSVLRNAEKAEYCKDVCLRNVNQIKNDPIIKERI